MTNHSRTTNPRTRRLPRLVALAVALLAVAALAPAVASAEPLDSEVTVEGRGMLWARGTGTADVSMAGWIGAEVDGDVAIIDHAGDARVRIGDGDDEASDPGRDLERRADIRLGDFEGRLSVVGSGFTIVIEGEARFLAKGKGRADLIGDGVYKTRHGQLVAWGGVVHLGGTEMDATG